jgi:hypothetical protein
LSGFRRTEAMAMHCSQSVVSKRQIAEEGIAGEDAPSVRGVRGAPV